MLEDNRHGIADVLDALAVGYMCTHDDMRADHIAVRRFTGAEMLRWCAKREATPDVDEVLELKALREFADKVEDTLYGPLTGTKRKHPATQIIKAIREALAKVRG